MRGAYFGCMVNSPEQTVHRVKPLFFIYGSLAIGKDRSCPPATRRLPAGVGKASVAGVIGIKGKAY